MKVYRDKKMILLPGKILMYYFLFTILAYLVGPYKWKIDNGVLLISYLIISYLFFWLGCKRFSKRIPNSYEIPFFSKNEIGYNKTLFEAIIAFVILSHLLYSFYIYGGISVTKVINMAQSYMDRLDSAYASKHNIITRLIAYFWGLNYIYIPYGIIKYRKLVLVDKILFFVAVFTNLLYWISIGTMKGIGDILIMIMLPLFISSITQRKKENTDASTEWKKKKRIIIILAIIFVVIFSFNIAQRSSLRGHTPYTVQSNIRAFVEGVNYNIPSGISSLMFYVSHGYTGLAYAMKLPFEWTYFIGNSRALTDIVETHILHNNAISSITYAQRLQDVYGWNNGEIWPSCFVWLASDITFFLVPLLIYVIAYIFTKAIYESINEQSVISLSLASYLLIFFIYLPCNNQIVQSDRSLFSLILIVGLYYMKEKRVVLKLNNDRIIIE